MSRFVLIKSFLAGDAEKADSIGIRFTARHKVAAVAALAVVTLEATSHRVGLRVPVVSRFVDDRLYGHADFVTAPERYRVHAP